MENSVFTTILFGNSISIVNIEAITWDGVDFPEFD